MDADDMAVDNSALAATFGLVGFASGLFFFFPLPYLLVLLLLGFVFLDPPRRCWAAQVPRAEDLLNSLFDLAQLLL